MRGGQGPTKRDIPKVWTTCLHRVWQRASLCIWDNPDFVQDTESPMEAPHCLQATKLRESWAHESDPQDYVSKSLSGDPVSLGWHATPDLLWAQCTLWSSGYSPFDILYGRPPPVIGNLKGNSQQLADLRMSWNLQALGSLSPCYSRNLRKDPCS